ncbi:capsular polysaccharide biosynthesis protein CapF [Metasolibacillus fluoroglycofenilyticus]|uniref:capsular polysaccharide biosynthesis protein CapF n=1 Tax=Metasolibacillus fluoroglycofenilyticus TaxID=1239396 RepID=UPI000D33DB83|nr:capsular polysaccharide biosynthesis protein CapF [Metasolibacillus fluoroglycofenilyticus]
MTIVVTGASGFIGKNLIAELGNYGNHRVVQVTRHTTEKELANYLKEATFVFHLAGINRPQHEEEFMQGNHDFTKQIVTYLKQLGNACPILVASSTQAERDNVYGQSKKAGEEVVFQYAEETGAQVFVYRLPNVFGKWCRPNYNSAIATFCHNISRDLEITVNDATVKLTLVYIDDVVREFINALEGKANKVGIYYEVATVHKQILGDIVELITSFKKSREERSVPTMSDAFTKALYSTYLSYLPENQFSYPLKMNVDLRGSFTEFIKTPDRGQVSVNISKPGITKGNHWHHTKNEKFLVVSGHGVIRFRKIGTKEVIEYFVSGEKLEVVDIPVGYTHNIENLGDTDMVTIMWVNEIFDPEKPDTFFVEV